MILTITPNPSVDYLFEADTLVWDDANRVETPRKRAGGQGINLTRAARALGAESVAMAFFGGSAGAELKALLAAEATPYIDVPISAETRVFFGVRETRSGRSMLVNPRGPILDEADRQRMLAQVARSCAQLTPAWVVASGSLPRGLGYDFYAAIAQIAHKHGARFVADCDGEALAKALAAGCDLIAPNQHEAERLAKTRINSSTDAAVAARILLQQCETVLLKLGADGAIAAANDGCWSARGPALQKGSAVGAGDAALAATLVANENGAPLQEALRSAVAAGTAVLYSTGSDLITHTDYQRVLKEVNVTAL